MQRTHLFILFAAFLLSVLVRLPVMDRPLSKHHEFNAAMALNVCYSWQLHGGPGKVYFAPIIHYGQPGDNYTAPHVHVKDSAVHYLSFGPGQFVLPYYIGVITGAAYTPLLLQVTGLLLHLISALLLWLIILEAFREHPRRQPAALLAAVAFIFTPATLWFFCNGYVHEVIVLPLVLGLGYTYLRWLHRPGPWKLLLLAVLAVCGVYTDWLMVFACMAVCLHSLLVFFAGGRPWKALQPVWVLGTAVVAALASLFILYSCRFGTEALFIYYKNASAARQMGGGSDEFSATRIVYLVLQHLATGYALLLPILIGILWWWRKRIGFWLRLRQGPGLLVCLLACTALYFFIFSQFSAEHDYSVLKFSYLLATLAAFCVLQWKQPRLRMAVFVLMVLGNIVVFYLVNRPGAIAQNGDPYNKALVWGRLIKQHTQPDEFLTMESNRENRTALIYYARRNIYQFATDADRDAYFRQSPQQKMCIISIKGDSLLFEHRKK